MGAIKLIAAQLIKKYGTNDPFEIASKKNILVRFVELKGILGCYQTYNRIPIILIHNGIDYLEQRFVCSHELGHRVLHPKINTPFLRTNSFMSIDKIEREANEFAVELLIPDNAIEEFNYSQISLADVAAIYGVPEQLAHLKSYSKY
jgi:Zn-dependent peptidase ImmA (M78 family)